MEKPRSLAEGQKVPPHSLDEMLLLQMMFQDGFRGTRHRDFGNPSQQRCEYLKDMCFAVEDELHELLAETGWKPWTSSWHVNREAAQMEWIDALCFMMNIANNLELSAERIYELYWEKYQVNLARQQGDYDGVSSKCANCKRALDDPHTKCKPPTVVEGITYVGYCIEKGWL